MTDLKSDQDRGYLGNLVYSMAAALIDDLTGLDVSVTDAGATVVIELKSGRDDIGKIIGKKGKNADAMRVIANAAANKLGRRVVLEIVG